MTLHQKYMYCPLLATKQKEKEEAWHGLCSEDHCAWWTGKECAILTIDKEMSGNKEQKKD